MFFTGVDVWERTSHHVCDASRDAASPRALAPLTNRRVKAIHPVNESISGTVGVLLYLRFPQGLLYQFSV